MKVVIPAPIQCVAVMRREAEDKI